MSEQIPEIGDRVRSIKWPGVSGVVERIEGNTYYTAKGFWFAHEVTVEKQCRCPEGKTECLSTTGDGNGK